MVLANMPAVAEGRHPQFSFECSSSEPIARASIRRAQNPTESARLVNRTERNTAPDAEHVRQVTKPSSRARLVRS